MHRIGDMAEDLRPAVEGDPRAVDYELYELEPDVARIDAGALRGALLLHDTVPEGPPLYERPSTDVRVLSVPVYGRVWTLLVAKPPGLLTGTERAAPWFVLVAGGAIGLAFGVVAHRDQRERAREFARLRELDEFRMRVIQTAAHELRTPLQPIHLQIYSLRRQLSGRGDEKTDKSLEMLDRNIERLTKSVDDVLDVAQLHARRLVLDPKDIDLSQVLGESVEAFRAAAREAGVELSASGDGPLPVRGDARRLGQVLFNLLGNALKFTPTGGRIHVEARPADRRAVVRVKDTGLGIRPEDLPRLFSPFSRVHDPSRKDIPGSGLGLFITRGIIEEHGGRIWCESEGLGKGTTFVFEIPLR
ncbi:MAG: sensor histidine kinase [Methanobacteriota archaeon]